MLNDQVKQLYDLSRSAVAARDALKVSVDRGLVAQYHRTVATSPEARIADPLLAVRRQLNDLAMERKRLLNDAKLDPQRAQFEVEQVDQAMTQVAEGTLLWARERMGLGVASVSAPAVDANTMPSGGEVL